MKAPFLSRILFVLLASFATFFPARLSNAAGIVTSATESSLRAALAGGGTVTFSTGGIITLSATVDIAKNTIVDGAGHNITISGNNSVPVFAVNSSVQFTLNNVTVANGRSSAGGGLINSGGITVLSNVTFTGNQAIGRDGVSGTSPNVGQLGSGGAIETEGGLLTANNCLFITNSVKGGGGGAYSGAGQVSGNGATGGTGVGAAIHCVGNLILTNCTFIGNQSMGGAGGAAGPGGGTGGNGGSASSGAIAVIGSLITVNCQFILNSAVSGVTPSLRSMSYYRGLADSGALSVSGPASVIGCSFVSNSVTGSPAVGGGIYAQTAALTISNSTFSANRVLADAASIYYDSTGSFGEGGALYLITAATISDSTFASNSATGGPGVTLSASENGGIADGGAIHASTAGSIVSLTRCLLIGNTATGGVSGENFSGGPTGATGGRAMGGAIWETLNVFSLVNCTLVGNVAMGGPGLQLIGNPNTGGNGFGGGVSDPGNGSSSISLTNCTLSGNQALGGIGGPGGTGTNGTGTGGNFSRANNTGVENFINTILTAGVPVNYSGILTDLGHNISSDASAAFSAAGSLTNTDPKLGALGNYGGNTQFFPLLPGSPAIDAGANTGLLTDQRGVARPYGTAIDIGAVEFAPILFVSGGVSNLALGDEVKVTVGTNSMTTSNHLFAVEGLSDGTYNVSASGSNYLFYPASQVTVGPSVTGFTLTALPLNKLIFLGQTNNSLHFVAGGKIGQPLRLLTSTDLSQWTPVSTNTLTSSNYIEFLIPITTSGSHFYATATP